MDIGAGNFEWGEDLVDFINREKMRPDITVHVINVRGERYTGETVEQRGQCKIYKLGAFKVEELANEFFEKHNLALENKIDLCVSNWCFRHLVDPVGTFTQVYNLLRPGGWVLIDGFFFLDQHTNDLEDKSGSYFNEQLFNLFLSIKDPFLMRYCDSVKSLNHFALKKLHDQPCPLSMSYMGVQPVSNGWQIGSDHVSKIKKEYQEQDVKQAWRSSVVQGDRSLYQWAKDHALFDKHHESISWIPAEKDYDYKALFPFHTAVNSGDLQLVEKLLTPEIIEEKDPSDKTPLYAAIRENRMEVFELLLQRGAEVGCMDYQAVTPLREAIKAADTNLRYVERLLEKGAQVDDKALFEAFAKGNPPLLKLLLEHGATAKNLYAAIDKENAPLVGLLLEYGTTITSEEITRAREQEPPLESQKIIDLLDQSLRNKQQR